MKQKSIEEGIDEVSNLIMMMAVKEKLLPSYNQQIEEHKKQLAKNAILVGAIYKNDKLEWNGKMWPKRLTSKIQKLFSQIRFVDLLDKIKDDQKEIALLNHRITEFQKLDQQLHTTMVVIFNMIWDMAKMEHEEVVQENLNLSLDDKLDQIRGLIHSQNGEAQRVLEHSKNIAHSLIKQCYEDNLWIRQKRCEKINQSFVM
ncbi:MAG: hypothetical protein V1707_03555 [bacterium]